MGLDRFTNPSASDISSGLVPVPPPVKQSDISAVRTNYGIGTGFKPKGQSDSSLYSHSVDFVLAWWKKNNPSVAAGTPPGGTGAGSTPGAGGGLAPKKGTGGATMPDTAMGTGLGPTTNLPKILTPQEKQTQLLGTQRGAATAVKATGLPVPPPPAPIKPPPAPQTYPNLTSNISGTVSKATAQSIMTQMGLRGATPPAAALTTTTALRAWVSKQLASQKLAQQRSAQTAARAGA